MSKTSLRYLFLLPLLFFSLKCISQNYNLTATSGTFTSLTGATPIAGIQGDNLISGTIPIGFTFNYFGSNYSSFKISSDGYMTFELTRTTSEAINNFSRNSIMRSIVPLWDDLSGDGGTASYKLTGTTGMRVLTVEWLNWKWDKTAADASISFQVKIYELSNKIEMIYRQEGGQVQNGSASIGLVGTFTTAYYSLTASSSSPTYDPTGFDRIDTRPATGQVYTFIPTSMTYSPPTVAASNIIVSDIERSSAKIAWTNGNGAYRAVFVGKANSSPSNFTPLIGTGYPGSAKYGDLSILPFVAADLQCVYNGTGNSVVVTNLQSTYTYTVLVVEYNGLANLQKYNGTRVASSFITALAAPTDPVTTLAAYHASSSQVTVRVNRGNGINQVVFVKASSVAETAPVVDNTTYTANASFGLGSQIGTTGWYCVFKGENLINSQWNLTINKLKDNTSYIIHAVDYNGGSGSEKYYVSPVANNPVQVSTFTSSPPSFPTYKFAASAGLFNPLTGGIAVDAIEATSKISGPIPIGFTFKMADLEFTQLVASTNGFLSFSPFIDKLGSSYSNDLNGLLRPIIAPLWDEMNGTGGQASYNTSGVGPNRIFTFEFLNWRWGWSGTAAAISFQVKLYETSNKIEFIYRPEAGAPNSSGASVGIAMPDFNTGNPIPTFLSLNNLSANATMSSTVETSSVSAKPISGQTFTFTPSKIDQTIFFPTVSSKSIGDASFNLSATASSGLDVTYTSSNTAIAQVKGKIVTIVGAGVVDIKAYQNGNEYYNEANSVSQTLIVKDNQTINFPVIPTVTLGDGSFMLNATASSGLAITYSTLTDKITLLAGKVTISKAGSVKIYAGQAGNIYYNAAESVDRTFCINPAKPVVTLAGLDTDVMTLISSNTLGNQWYKEGAAITGATAATFRPATPGVYTVITTVDNCSSAASDAQAIIITGMEDVSKLITISPNPAQKEVSIDLTSLGKEVSADVAIFDLTGRVFHSSTGKGVMTVNIASYEKGSYLVRVKAGSRIITKQIAKN